jgi:hypothetical protein
MPIAALVPVAALLSGTWYILAVSSFVASFAVPQLSLLLLSVVQGLSFWLLLLSLLGGLAWVVPSVSCSVGLGWHSHLLLVVSGASAGMSESA